MQRLLPRCGVALCSRARTLPSTSSSSSVWSRPHKLICCIRPCTPPFLTRCVSTSSPLHRHSLANEERKEREEDTHGEDGDDQRTPLPHRFSSPSDSSTLPLKYLLRSDFFSSLLRAAYPNLTPLHYRTHLAPFVHANRHNKHLHHVVHQLLSGDDTGGQAEAGRKRRKHSKRNRQTKLIREVAFIYARYVRDETGEAQVAERQKAQRVKGALSRKGAVAEQEDEEEEEGEQEEDEEEDEEDREESIDRFGRARPGRARARQFDASEEHIAEDEAGQQPRQSPLHSASFLRGRGGRLRYDPSLAFLANLSQPHQTFPLARSLQRTIILHTGPTNSGKTHAAMQALQSAATGVYAAPLRLLAWEQYDRMTKRGVKAELLTGQELETTADATHTSCTIEVASVERLFDVAVIDEVQMIGSEDRGGAWTRALLGIAAKIVHVCGDMSVRALMEDLCSVTGEELRVVEYERLVPLQLSPPLLSLANLRRGDCIIAFARSELYALKHSIETSTRLRCAIIYGSLPPTLRRQQAELFNAVDGPYDVLVATDAVGQGLNLQIGRVIFSTLTKFDGREERLLTVRETLQIAGRAGRYAGAFQQGQVTTLTHDRFGQLKRLMHGQLEPLTHAGLSVSLAQLEALAVHRPNEGFHHLLRYMEQFAALDDLFFLADLSQWIAVAKLLHAFPTLSLHERYVFCLSPVSADKPVERAILLSFLHQYTAPGGTLLTPPTVSWRPLADWHRLSSLASTATDLLQLEEAWKALDIYVWLSRRLGEDRFAEREAAEAMRERVSEKIALALAGMSQSELRKRRGAARRERLAAERRRLAGAANKEWTEVEEGGEQAEVREARLEVVDTLAAADAHVR